MVRPLLALAIVKKLKPRLSVLDIYSLKDDPKPEKDEKIIKVVIMKK